MKAFGVRIRTPLDFKRAMGGEAFSQDICFRPSVEEEPKLREVLGAIFDDLPCMSVDDEPGLLSSYLESIKSPLDELDALGVMMFAVGVTGTKTIAGKPMSWTNTRFLILKKDAYFRMGEALLENTVHRFDDSCKDAIEDLAEATAKQLPLNWWATREAVSKLMEGNVPWCHTCCSAEALG